MITERIHDKNLFEKYRRTRQYTEKLSEKIREEYLNLQPVVFVSPPKWHLGHTTWFFEEFILVQKQKKKYFDKAYSFFFNSYYETLGDRISRDSRGTLTKPKLEEVIAYRRHVDELMLEYLDKNEPDEFTRSVLELGINHEQQHQELLLTDIKYILSLDPALPAFNNSRYIPSVKTSNDPIELNAGVYKVGYEGEGFCFDNEKGAHSVYINDVKIDSGTVLNSEFLEFIYDKGYERAGLWLSDGWDWVKKNQISMPLYWMKDEEKNFKRYSLNGLEKIKPDEPVSHVSYYEADAFARWKGKRLPTEFEWEIAAKQSTAGAAQLNFSDNGHFEPVPHDDSHHLLGNVWEWTGSAYLPYPFYKRPEGAVGEYNGKFMINQMVLRGGSCVTPEDHIRITYRNFFRPEERWQFSGIRLAEDV